MKVAGKASRVRRVDAGSDGDNEERALRERALTAMDRAYAPYSNFLVGAALLGTDGSITEACNVENAAFPAGTCAERAALAAAIARGVRSFRVLMIATSADEPTPPCGMCRQALIEFAPELEIVSVTRTGKKTRWRLSELLPHAFSPSSLDRSTD
ncbi:MAG TPA: cytidine deaminase [Gemmatimonadaceae bacterium]